MLPYTLNLHEKKYFALFHFVSGYQTLVVIKFVFTDILTFRFYFW